MGISFAIPVNSIKEISNTLISGKSVERGFLGVMIQDVTPDMAEYFHGKANNGALIADINEDSPAAGTLKQDDIVLNFDGHPVKDAAGLRNMVAMSKPETDSKLHILRNGEERDVTVRLGKREEETVTAASNKAAPSTLGLSLQNLTPDLAQQFNLENQKGVIVTQVEPGSTAERAHLEPGMLILEVNRKPVANVAQFQKAVADSDGNVLLIRYTDGKQSLYTTLRKE
jgi:serine protease Do